MKNHLLLLLISLFCLCSCEKGDTVSCGLEPTTDSAPQFLKVLYIGNSLTYTNFMTRNIAMMASSGGDSIYTGLSTPDGYDFERHSVMTATIDAIWSQKWDVVVLQEQGYRASLPDSVAAILIYPYADSLYRMIKANHEDTRVILYMTHAYRYGIDWCSKDTALCTYEGAQENTKRTYMHLSAQLDAPVAPAGMIWKIIRNEYPGLELFHYDGIHASVLGSYISACTIYSLIFRKRPENVYIPEKVTAEEAAIIQETVSSVLFDCNPDWVNY